MVYTWFCFLWDLPVWSCALGSFYFKPLFCFFYHLHFYSFTFIQLWVARQVHLGLGPYLSKWDWQLAFSSLRDYRGEWGGGEKVFFALLLSDTALTFTAGSDTAPTTKLFPHPNKLREKLKTENKSHMKGIWNVCSLVPSAGILSHNQLKCHSIDISHHS